MILLFKTWFWIKWWHIGSRIAQLISIKYSNNIHDTTLQWWNMRLNYNALIYVRSPWHSRSLVWTTQLDIISRIFMMIMSMGLWLLIGGLKLTSIHQEVSTNKSLHFNMWDWRLLLLLFQHDNHLFLFKTSTSKDKWNLQS